MVALLCLRPARSGGLSCVLSSVALHDEVARTRPDLARVLYEARWRDHRTGDGPDSFYQAPVFSRSGGRISVSYGPDCILSAQRGPGVPPLTGRQLDAMALLDELCSEPRFVLTMDLQAGDLQVLSNHVTLHSRTSFADHPEAGRRRDLIRLRIRC
jgi:hypothetical protein